MKKVCHFLLNLLRQHTILIFFRNLLSRILRNSKVFLRVYPTVKLSKKEFEVVIAQYNEDIRWSDALKDNRTVYNKGVRLDCPYAIKLPNVGREAHTYLWHIVNNYKRLANITLFTQGSIEENSFNFEWIRREPAWRGKSVLDTVLSCRLLSRTISIAMPFFEYGVKGIDKSGKIQFAGKWLEELKTGHMMNSEYDFINWINKYVFNKHRYGLEDINWIPHSVFYVHKDLILANSKEYYENLLATVSDHINPMEGHYFERAWFHIFTRNYYYKISIILIWILQSFFYVRDVRLR